MADKKPLWRVMHEAYWRVAGCDGFDPPASPDCYAAELRAIADVVVPEAPSPSRWQYRTERFWFMVYTAWEERQRIRALLLAEAERAEKGDANG
jgi:hypothetical protein